MRCTPWYRPHKYGMWFIGFHYNDVSYVAYDPKTRTVQECSRCGWQRTKDIDRHEGL